MEKRQAKVYYQKTADGKNKVVKLEGFLTREEIENISSEVSRIWGSQENKMYLWKGDELQYIWGNWFGSNIYNDIILDNEEFNKVISEMKVCGKILAKIIKDVAAVEAQEIKVISI